MPINRFENNGTHLHFPNSDSILSIINSENYSYVVLKTKKTFAILYKSADFENVTDINVIPLPKNKLPLLLTRNIQPDTDVMWDNLLIFNGTKYSVADRQRIEKRIAQETD